MTLFGERRRPHPALLAAGAVAVVVGVYLRHFGEEAVAADIETPTVALHGAADTAHDVVGFEHGGPPSHLAQLVGRGQARRAGADDYDIAGQIARLISHSELP